MPLLPVAHPLGVLGIPEIILVLRFSQPSSLRLSLAGSTAIGFEAMALALNIPVIGKKKFLAVQTFAAGFQRLHRFQNWEEPVIGKPNYQAEENPPGRRLTKAKKEEDFSANASKKSPAKKIHFYTGSFDPFPFWRWQACSLVTCGPLKAEKRTQSIVQNQRSGTEVEQ